MRARPEAIKWIQAYYEAVDGRRFDLVAQYLHEQCEIQYPTGAAISGRDQIVHGMQSALGALAGTRHELKGAWEEEQELLFELQVTYQRNDGQRLVRPGAGIFVFDEGKIRQQRLFVDSHGVWD